MPSLHIMTVAPGLPPWLLDHVLTRVEEALIEIGASQVWISPDLPALAVMAEIPLEAPES